MEDSSWRDRVGGMFKEKAKSQELVEHDPFMSALESRKEKAEETRVELPIFVRDIDEYGEQFIPEVAGCAIHRVSRLPVKFPIFNKLFFNCHSLRIPIGSSGADVSLLTKNARFNLHIQSLAQPDKYQSDSELYNLTDTGLVTPSWDGLQFVDVAMVFCYKVEMDDYLPYSISRFNFVQSVEFILIENVKKYHQQILRSGDENQVVLTSKAIRVRSVECRFILRLLSDTEMSHLGVEPALLLSNSKTNFKAHIELWRLTTMASIVLFQNWRKWSLYYLLLLMNTPQSFHYQIPFYSWVDTEDRQQQTASKLQVVVSKSKPMSHIQYSGEIPNLKDLDEVTFAIELERRKGLCQAEKYGLSLSIVSCNVAKSYSLAKFTYYAGFGKHSFHVPLYFDYPPEFVAPRSAEVIVVTILGVSLFKFIRNVFQKERVTNPSSGKKSFQIVSRKKWQEESDNLAILAADLKCKCNAESESILDVSPQIRHLTKENSVIRSRNIGMLPGIPVRNVTEIESLSIRYVVKGKEISLVIPNGCPPVDLIQVAKSIRTNDG